MFTAHRQGDTVVAKFFFVLLTDKIWWRRDHECDAIVRDVVHVSRISADERSAIIRFGCDLRVVQEFRRLEATVKG
jgi:hypothetical protein